MTKRKTEDTADESVVQPTINPVIDPTDKPLTEWTEAEARAFVDRQNLAAMTLASIELVGLLREVLTHTHATARLPPDLLRRIQEAVA